jgi:DNA-binding CsgD family transcriptional regulator
MGRALRMHGKTLLEQASAFAAKCDSLASMDELSAAIVALVAPFGYPNVASGVLVNTGKMETLHFAKWNPAWLDLYMRSGFPRIDPVPIWAVSCGTPVDAGQLREWLPRGHPALKMFNAAEPFGILGGYVVPQRAADNKFGVVAYIGHKDPSSAEERFTLRALAGVVFDRAEALIGRRPRESVAPPPPEISERERECLLHLIDGRSTAFIAKAMDVTEVTVRFHSRNLRAKTGATNRAQLTALAIAQGLAPR